MNQIIRNLALMAALAVLSASLWQDWGVLTTVKRMMISYLGFFFLGSIMVLAVKLIGMLDKDHPGDLENGEQTAGVSRKR